MGGAEKGWSIAVVGYGHREGGRCAHCDGVLCEGVEGEGSGRGEGVVGVLPVLLYGEVWIWSGLA